MRNRAQAQARVSYGYRRLHVCGNGREGSKPQEGIPALQPGEPDAEDRQTQRHVSWQRRVGLPVAAWVDESWSMDFISNEFSDERRIRLLTIVENL